MAAWFATPPCRQFREAINQNGHLTRKILTILPLVAMIAACSDNDSLESQGQKAGAAADHAI
jgi:hypothetical protein